MKRELVDLLGGVQNEVGGQQAEVAELVAEGLVPAPRELEDQATQSGTRQKNAYALSRLLVMHLSSQLLHEVLIHFVEQRSEGLLSLRLAFGRPLAHKRPERAPHLVDILRADALRPHHQVPIGELLSLEHALVFRDDLVEEALVHEVAVL